MSSGLASGLPPEPMKIFEIRKINFCGLLPGDYARCRGPIFLSGALDPVFYRIPVRHQQNWVLVLGLVDFNNRRNM